MQWRGKLHEYSWISDRIVNLIFETDRGYLTVTASYEPKERN